MKFSTFPHSASDRKVSFASAEKGGRKQLAVTVLVEVQAMAVCVSGEWLYICIRCIYVPLYKLRSAPVQSHVCICVSVSVDALV